MYRSTYTRKTNILSLSIIWRQKISAMDLGCSVTSSTPTVLQRWNCVNSVTSCLLFVRETTKSSIAWRCVAVRRSRFQTGTHGGAYVARGSRLALIAVWTSLEVPDWHAWRCVATRRLKFRLARMAVRGCTSLDVPDWHVYASLPDVTKHFQIWRNLNTYRQSFYFTRYERQAATSFSSRI